MSYKIILTVFIIALIYSCKEEQELNELKEELPIVITNNAHVYEDGGVNLSGKTSKLTNINEHGFIYSIDSTFSKMLIDTVKLGKEMEEDVFAYDVLHGLYRDINYFYKAFIIYNNVEICGNVQRFKSNGNKQPEIISFSPQFGHIGDTVSIRVKYFGNEHTASIYFDRVKSKLIEQNDSVIKCVVPEAINTNELAVKISNVYGTANSNFNLYKPTISEIIPSLVTFGDTITVKGNHFDFETDRNIVKIGNVTSHIISSNRYEIVCTIPNEIETSKEFVSVMSQFSEVLSNESVKLKKPIITLVPDCSATKEEFIIKGDFFHPITNLNKITIEGIEVNIIKGSIDSLVIQVPVGPFPREVFDLNLKVLDMEEKWGKDICISDDWIMVSNTLPFSCFINPGVFEIESSAYVVLYDRLWQFSPDTKEWNAKSTPEGAEILEAVSNGEHGYVYLKGAKDNFFMYNHSTDSWIKKADFPGKVTYGATSFSINKEIYIGLGSYQNEEGFTTGLTEFHKYNPQTNEWTRIADVPIKLYNYRNSASSFTIDGKAFLTGGASSTGEYDSWSYDPAKNEWIAIADFKAPYNAVGYTSAFVLGGKGYITGASQVGGSGNNKCWEYDPINDMWSLYNEIGHFGRYGGFSFSIGDDAYVGSGYSSYPYGDVNVQLYKLNPNNVQ